MISIAVEMRRRIHRLKDETLFARDAIFGFDRIQKSDPAVISEYYVEHCDHAHDDRIDIYSKLFPQFCGKVYL